jgi:class 3 adenylate cyclase
MTTESVAVLFTDMVDSTALFQRLSPEAADQLRHEHFNLLRIALSTAGGTEVKNLGDGLMAVFSSASAAVACAVSMQQAVEQDNRSRDDAIKLRIGLSAGEVAHDEDDYFGDPVVEAARMCATCEPSQILASDLAQRLAGRRSQAGFRPLGAIALKGLPEPLLVVAVEWEPLAPARSGVPLPGRLAAHCADRMDLVGREAELATLASAAQRVFSGEGRHAVFVSGEPGQGKTTLIAEAARLAFEDGACVLFGYSEEDLSTPYGLFSEAFGHYADHAPDDRFHQLVGAHGAEWGRFVPKFVERSPSLAPSKATDPDSERYLLFAATADLLRGMSQDEPVVLVLDDLQWADPGSLALLRHLMSTDGQRMRVLIAGTFRSSELSVTPALRETLGVLWRHRGVSRVELGGIDPSSVASLLAAATGRPVDDEVSRLAEIVHQETSGNPFFVTEVLRHLLDTGILVEARGDGPGPDVLDRIDLPTSVREVVSGRVTRLGPDAERVLSTAAVVGRAFDLELLAEATQLAPEPLLDVLDAAESASLVTGVDGPSGRFAFSHALVQRTLYDGLGATRRAFIHERIALALEELVEVRGEERVGELAHHWMAAPRPANLPKALRYSQRAGTAALESLAPDDAARHFASALELSRRSDRVNANVMVDLAIGLGTAQRQVGDPIYRDTLLGAARDADRLDDVGRLVIACLANDRGFYSAVGSADTEKIDALELALAKVEADNPDRALILATLCSELAHGSSLERRQSLAEEAIAIAKRSGDEAVMVRVLNHLHVALQVPSMLERTEAWAAEGLELAERIGDPVLVFWAAQWRIESAARRGNIGELDRCLAIHGDMADALGQSLFSWGHAFVQSLRSQIAGDAQAAERFALQALEIGTQGGQPDAALIFGGQMNIVAGQLGTQHELVPLIEKMAGETRDIPRSFFLSLLAKAYVEGDECAQASELLDEFAGMGYELPLDQLWLTGMVDFAEAAIECNHRRHAARLLEQLEPWSGQLPATGGSALSPVSHYLGGLATVLGDFDRAESYFEQSAEMCRRMGAIFFAGRTNLLWGRMLVQRGLPGDADRGHRLLTEALETARSRSYGGVERRAAAALSGIASQA